MDVERKAYTPFEVKEINERARTFSGLASTWDVDFDGDRIERGSFKKALDDWRGAKGKKLIPLIDQHNYMSVRAVFGRMVEAKETDAGLDATFEIVNTPDGDEYLTRIKDGFLNGLSIGFRTVQSEPEKDKNSSARRVIKEVRLEEVSAVIWGANPEALIDTAAMKSLFKTHPDRVRESLEAQRREIEQFLAKQAPADDEDPEEEIDPGEEGGESEAAEEGEAEEASEAPPEIVEVEKELAAAIAAKDEAVAREDYDSAALHRDRIRGIEARLKRKQDELVSKRAKRVRWTPDDPARLKAEALFARSRAFLAAGE